MIDTSSRESRLFGLPGATLKDRLIEHGFAVPAICDGCCSFGTCHVYLELAPGTPPPPMDEAERGLLRVSCCG